MLQKTSDYTQFRYLDGNRKIQQTHFKKLKESIQRHNHLDLHPIIVNKNREVIDGQHRLEVAKQLSLDIYFIIADDVETQHLIDCNVNQKCWEISNFIDYYSTKEKRKDYIKIKEMLELSRLRPKALITIVTGNIANDVLEKIKKGSFELPHKEEYEGPFYSYMQFMEYVTDKRIKPISMFTNYYFTRSYRWLFFTKGFDYTVFANKLDLKWFDLKPQHGSEGWYKLLISIYNFKNQNKLEEEFLIKK